MQLKSLWIDLQLKNIQQDLIACEKIEPKENLGALLKLTHEIWCKTGKKHQMKDELHTQCEQKQDNFKLSNHKNCYYQVYNTS